MFIGSELGSIGTLSRLGLEKFRLVPVVDVIKLFWRKSRFPPNNFAENNLVSDLICKFIVQIIIILAKLAFKTVFIN